MKKNSYETQIRHFENRNPNVTQQNGAHLFINTILYKFKISIIILFCSFVMEGYKNCKIKL